MLAQLLYTLAAFPHAKINRAYFEAQRALLQLKGRQGIWVAGVYTNDVDSHESAIRPAIAIVIARHRGGPAAGNRAGGERAGGRAT